MPPLSCKSPFEASYGLLRKTPAHNSLQKASATDKRSSLFAWGQTKIKISKIVKIQTSSSALRNNFTLFEKKGEKPN